MNSLALLAGVLLCMSPGAIYDAGFQLTFLATAGILALSPRLVTILPLPKPLAMGVSVSASAYLACAPVIAWHFGRLTPIALLSNLSAAPLCGGILISGYTAILLHGVPLLHDLLVWLGGFSAAGLLKVTALASALEFSGFRVPPPSLTVSACYYSLLASLVVLRGGRGRSAGWKSVSCGSAASVAIVALLVWLHLGPPPASGGAVQAAVLDVGQGQAVAVRGPRGEVILVDAAGGPNPRFEPGERLVLPFLAAWRVRRVQVQAVSHGDIDHAGGAFSILRELEVGELWLGPGFHRDPRQAELAEAARKRGTAIVLAQRGMKAVRAGMRIEVLAPGAEDDYLLSNDRSVVLRIGAAPARIMVPGDIERLGERALLDSGRAMEAEALVVGHHGSAGSTSTEFLGRVRPRHAVVSCGFRNRFRHPRSEVVRRIGAVGARLWRTDRDGMVLLTAEGDGWTVLATRR